MKTNNFILSPDFLSKAANEAARIIENEPQTWNQATPVSQCYGALGTMSPLSRPAFVRMFGEEITAAIEKDARAILAAKAEKHAQTHYAQHAKEADAANGVPVAGSFFWCVNSGLKCDGGRGRFGEVEHLFWSLQQDHPIRERLCTALEIITVSAEEFDRVTLADELVQERNLKGGSRSEDIDDETRTRFNYTEEELATFYTVGAVVTDGARWFLIDSEGYDYPRYIYLPTNWATMYAEELKSAEKAEQERKEAEEKGKAEAKAARLAEYNARAAKWLPLMQDIRPIQAAEKATHDEARQCWKKGTKEHEAMKAAERKVSNTRRANILAMVRAAFPGVVFSLHLNHGWGSTYTLTWQDGPTVDEFNKATDLDLFCQCCDTFDGMTDCAGIEWAEFTEFATYTMGDHIHGDIEIRREHGGAFECIKDRLTEILPEVKGQDDPSITDEQITRIYAELTKSDPQLFDEDGWSRANLFGSRWFLSVVSQIWSITSFYTRPEEPTTPTDPTDPQPKKKHTPTDTEGARPEGLQLVEISGGVAVTGDTRTTYRNRAAIKAHGAKWNKDANQWQATDAESVAALREWFGITAEPVASATTEPTETATDCKGLSVQNYRFTAEEVERMKDFILVSIENEREKKTAWRARLCYEGSAYCTGTKKSRERGARMLALYEYLTTDDLPNWAA